MVDKNEQENIISSTEKELELLNLEAEQLSKKTLLREKQLDDGKKQNTQEEQGICGCFLMGAKYQIYAIQLIRVVGRGRGVPAIQISDI